MSTFYGSDTACLYDTGLVDVIVTDPKRLIGERLGRRLQTPRGALAAINDDPNFGFDVRQFTLGKFGPTQLAAAQSQVAAECLKDEQVASCTCVIALGQGGALSISLSVVTSAGPFVYTLNVTALTVDLLYSAQAGT